MSNRRDRLRAKILHDHLEQIATRRQNNLQTLTAGLSSASAISLVGETMRRTSTEDTSSIDSCEETLQCLPGALSEKDLQQFTQPIATSIDPELEANLNAELKQTLLSILSYWSEEETSPEIALQLPKLLQDQQNRAVQAQATSQQLSEQIQLLTEDINTIHPQLMSDLTNGLMTLPALSLASSVAQADVVASTIETSLLKLSLTQAQAYKSLYGHVSPVASSMSMGDAITAIIAKLHMQELAQDQEEHMLAAQIKEYDQMLQVVDGHEGGFGQVVEDMARVQQEIEECRRDLRRLGWTGD